MNNLLNTQNNSQTLTCIQDAPNAFRCGLAAASASCLAVDLTSHFDKKMMDRIFDKITFYETEMKDFPLINPLDHRSQVPGIDRSNPSAPQPQPSP